MAISSVGYDGSVGEQQLAAWTQTLSSVPHVVSGMGARTIVGTDRGVGIAAGMAAGFGVRDTSSTEVIVQCGSTTSTRWDTIVLRRNWSLTANLNAVPPTPGGVSSIEVVPGTSSKVITGNLQAQPGVVADQPLWLAKVQSGSSVVTELVPVWARSSQVVDVPSLLALPNPPLGTVAQVGDTMYYRRLDASGTPAWVTNDTGPMPAGGAGTGWTFLNSLRRKDGWAVLKVDMIRAGSNFSATDIYPVGGVPIDPSLRPGEAFYYTVLNQATRQGYLLEVPPSGVIRMVQVSASTNDRFRGTFTWPVG